MMPERQPCCSSVEPVLKNPVKQRLYRVYAKQKNREPAACLQNRVPRVRILLPLPKETPQSVSLFSFYCKLNPKARACRAAPPKRRLRRMKRGWAGAAAETARPEPGRSKGACTASSTSFAFCGKM